MLIIFLWKNKTLSSYILFNVYFYEYIIFVFFPLWIISTKNNGVARNNTLRNFDECVDDILNDLF